MRLPRETYQIQQTIETHLPQLTQTQLAGLACVTTVWGLCLAKRLPECRRVQPSPPGATGTACGSLREWLSDGGDRARPWKAELDVSLCFAPLLLGPGVVVFRPVSWRLIPR